MTALHWVNRLKKKWNIERNVDFFVIMLVFSIAGMTIVFERRPLFHMFGIKATTPFWIKFFVWLAVVFPSYQINLIIFGFLMGQFDFFWEKEKKLGRFFRRAVFGRTTTK